MAASPTEAGWAGNTIVVLHRCHGVGAPVELLLCCKALGAKNGRKTDDPPRSKASPQRFLALVLRLTDAFRTLATCALEAATGEKIWHYQPVRHGLWDYDTPAAPLTSMDQGCGTCSEPE